jgi:hypothetical protein
LDSLRRSNLICIFVIFVPGHTGVRKNERANRLAGTAVIYYGSAMNHSDVLHALCEAERVDDSLEDSESDTMERLRDGHVKLGVTRYEQYVGSQRRIVNQMRTGTVSRHTLLNVLKRRLEHLWVCPECKDDNLSTNH